TYAVQKVMSALPPKADIRESDWFVNRARFTQPMKNVGRRGRMLKYSGRKITERPHKSSLLPVENSYAIFAFALPATGPRMG
ncbi:MAG: hypothetical protein WCF80_23755, partial [Pseudolabrys sp.]